MQALHVVILAAGQGTRMVSETPKVLHLLAGKPLLHWVIEAALCLNPEAVHVIYGHHGEQLQQSCQAFKLNWVLQKQQLGTGHAILQALPYLPKEASVLILSGDVPLINPDTLFSLINHGYHKHYSISLLLAHLDNPLGLGRIVRHHGRIKAIVEEKDASLAERNIQEIYSGIAWIQAQKLHRWLPQLTANNAQKEYYLTDIIKLAVGENIEIGSMAVEDPLEIQGVNNRLQLHDLERACQRRKAQALLLQGIGIADSSRLDIRGELTVGHDSFIDVNTLFVGKVVIGNHCRIGANCSLTNVTIADNTEVLANSVLEDCSIGNHCRVGPFARLRPGTSLADYCHIGNFVETKQAAIAAGTKANHLSYLGDVTIGSQVNIGAGTIVCNYDGAYKHPTVIENNVFIGSGTQLVAPVTVAQGATVGAGSTIRRNVPAHQLTLTVANQKTVVGWKRPVKEKI